MLNNKYNIAGCCIEIKTDGPLINEGNFSKFSADFDSPHCSVEIIETESLPEAKGECIFNSDTKRVYFGEDRLEFKAYFNVKENRYIDFACKVNEDKLFVSTGQALRELVVFDGLNLPSVLLKNNIAIMHSSFIEHNSKAILFAGSKQVGKSTQAALWQSFADAQIINGDRAGIGFDNSLPFAAGVPFSGTSGVCQNERYPIKAIICLSQWGKNEIRRLSELQAFMAVLGTVAYDSYNLVDAQKAIELSHQIVKNTPVYSYTCTNDESAVKFLLNNI